MTRITQIILLLAFLPGAGFSQTDIELLYTSFYGGNLFESANAVDYNDQIPNEWVIGAYTESNNLETIGNSYQPFFGGGLQDAFYARLDSDGNVIYSTFFGGSGSDSAVDLILDDNGEILIGGTTGSSDFPLENAHNPNYNGFNSGWLAKFDEFDGLLWSTYIGGDGDLDIVQGISADGSGNVFVCGNSTSTDLATEGVFQEEIVNPDVFSGILGKYNTDGELVWLTYFADEATVILKAVAVSPDGQTVYAAGLTSREDSFSEPSHQSANAGGTDAVLLAFSSSGGTLEWGTYFGGVGYDEISEIVLSESGDIIIGGHSYSETGIATNGAFQETLGGSSDYFTAAFTPVGELQWSTYIGGSMNELGNVHLEIQNNQLYFGGSVKSANMTLVGNPYFSEVQQSEINIGVGYLAKFELDGSIIWSTFSNEFYPCGSCSEMVVSIENKIFCVGAYLDEAASEECEAAISPNAFQTEYGGGNADIGIFIFEENLLSTSFPQAEPLSIYPNPARDQVSIEVPNLLRAGMNLTVTDLSGRVVDRVARFQSGNAYSTSHLSEGVYILIGQIGERMFRQKLVVQR